MSASRQMLYSLPVLLFSEEDTNTRELKTLLKSAVSCCPAAPI